ncbi:MAG: 6-bladed beta-propeller [Gemmatimonadota bacterium]
MRHLWLPLVVIAVPVAAQTPAKWRLVPEVTYGAADESAGELSDVRGIEVAKNGNVLVLDYKAQAVKLFAPDGKFIRNIGRGGGGPAEYETPNGFTRAPDGTIWINDPGNNRVTILREDGTLVKTMPRDVHTYGFIWDGKFDRQGRLMQGVSAPPPRGYRLQRTNYLTGQADSLVPRGCVPPEVVADTRPSSYSFRSKTGGGTTMGIPFTPDMMKVVHPAGYIWCAYGSTYTVYRIGLEKGDTLGVIRGEAPALPIPASVRDAAIANIKEIASKYGEPNYSPAGIPTSYPRLHELQIDDRDRIWVGLTPVGTPEARYDVYSADGKLVAKASIPSRLKGYLSFVFRGDKLYALAQDADDVPLVMRFRIEVVK